MYLENSSGANLSTAQSLTVTTVSTNSFDVTGAGGPNTLVTNMIGAGGVATGLGYDIGAGEGVATPFVNVSIGAVTTFTGTLTISLQCAPDNGFGAAGTSVVLFTSAALSGTSQVYNGAQMIIPVPPLPAGLLPAGALPRFYNLNYATTSTTNLKISASIVLNPPTLRDATLYGNNFPAGL